MACPGSGLDDELCGDCEATRTDAGSLHQRGQRSGQDRWGLRIQVTAGQLGSWAVRQLGSWAARQLGSWAARQLGSWAASQLGS